MNIVLINSDTIGGEATGGQEGEGVLESMAKALESFGHQTDIVPTGIDTLSVISELDNPEVIMLSSIEEDDENLVSLFGMLDLTGLPVVGSEISTHVLSHNQDILKVVLEKAEVGTAASQIFLTGYEGISGELDYPLIVRPEQGELKEKDLKKSFVENRNDLRNVILETIRNYRDSVIVEEFFIGREFEVSIWGNINTEVLPIVEIVEGQQIGLDDDELEEKIVEVVEKAYRALRCEVYANFTVKLDRSGEPNITDFDSLPSLEEDSNFAQAAEKAGYPYAEMLDRVVKLGMNYE